MNSDSLNMVSRLGEGHMPGTFFLSEPQLKTTVDSTCTPSVTQPPLSLSSILTSYLSALDFYISLVWSFKFAVDFFPILNWIFADYTGGKIRVEIEKKNKFIKLEISN